MRKLFFFLFLLPALALKAWPQTQVGSQILSHTQSLDVISLQPYLQNPTGSGITLMWQTSVPAYCWVEYEPIAKDSAKGEASSVGITTGDVIQGPSRMRIARHMLDGQVVCNNTEHKVRLENLQPGMEYRYRICAREIKDYQAYKKVFGASDSTQFYNFSLPDPSSSDFTALVFNDLHKQEVTFKALLSAVGNIRYDFVVFNGDCVDDPANKEQATAYIKVLNEGAKAASVPVFYIRGNHEIRNAYSIGLRDLLEYTYGKTYGAFSWGDTRFVILDCGEDKPDDHWVYYGLNDFSALRAEQMEFLKKELASASFQKASKRVLLHHIPIYGNDDEYQPCKEVWGEILAKAPFNLCLNAHTHRYAFHPKGELGNNFPVYIGGGPKMENATVMVLQKKGDVLTLTVLDTAGKVLLSSAK